MSKYVELETVLSDEKYLIESLTELGYTPEVALQGRSLVGYMGDVRQETANVILRRNQLDSASNDIGFARDASGIFRAIISDYDRSIGFDGAWLGKVTQAYKERQTMAVARAKGYVFKGRQVLETPQGKKVQLRFAVR